MLRYYLLALGCVALCQAARIVQARPGTQPGFCNLECPQFDSVSSTDDYEVRRYHNAKWASTKVTNAISGIAGSIGFRRLFNYIGGENGAGVNIEMTQPVLMKVPEETSWWFFKEYTISFLLPREHWDNPPAPTSSDVFIQETPEMVAYVKSFGGWANGWNSASHYRTMAQKLTENGVTFDDSFYLTAQYNAPFEMTNRHNEVWVLGTSGSD